MVLSLNYVENFFPLLGIRVDASWVMGTNMQKDYGVVFRIFEIFSEAFEVKALCVGVVVAVVLPLLANNFNNSSVKGPRRVWSEDVDIFVGIPISKERETKSQGTSSRNTLSSGDATFLQLFVVSSECKRK